MIAVVESRLAAAILRQRQGFDQDSETWDGLAELASELRRELARLESFSDESAPTLKELSRKLETVDRALAYLDEHRLGPREGGDLG